MTNGECSVEERPAIWRWYVVYCVSMVVLYAIVLMFGLILLFVNPSVFDMKPLEAKLSGSLYTVIAIPLLLVYGVAPFLPLRPWTWVAGIVLICLGMTSCCCLPACIPLLIYWIKPETKGFFGFQAPIRPPPIGPPAGEAPAGGGPA